MTALPHLKGIIFDLDGTLGNTLPICFKAFRCTFEHFLGVSYSDREIASLFGPSEEGIIERLVPDRATVCLQKYLDEYEKAHESLQEPFPGIETALNLLQEKEIPMAIVTGKGKNSAAISLRYLGLESYFETVMAGSPLGAVKPIAIKTILQKWNLTPDNAAYVGDSTSDIQDAQEVGVIPLAAAWAETTDRERLNAMNPSMTFSQVDSFIDWLDRIF